MAYRNGSSSTIDIEAVIYATRLSSPLNSLLRDCDPLCIDYRVSLTQFTLPHRTRIPSPIRSHTVEVPPPSPRRSSLLWGSSSSSWWCPMMAVTPLSTPLLQWTPLLPSTHRLASFITVAAALPRPLQRPLLARRLDPLVIGHLVALVAAGDFLLSPQPLSTRPIAPRRKPLLIR